MTAWLQASESASPTHDRPVLGMRGWEAGEEGRARQGPQVAFQEPGRTGHAPLTAARFTVMKLVSNQDLPCLVSLLPRPPSPPPCLKRDVRDSAVGPRPRLQRLSGARARPTAVMQMSHSGDLGGFFDYIVSDCASPASAPSPGARKVNS